jgi:integrase/recombinase XerD
MSTDLVPYHAPLEVIANRHALREIIRLAGPAADFAADEFFEGKIRNEHTRRAYRHAIKGLLVWAARQSIRMTDITPGDVGRYLNSMVDTTSIATRKQHLSALRHFFDGMVTRHVMALNPALSVRGERYEVVEGKTPEITVAHARTLLASIDTSNVIGLRDRALLAILIYTASRAGAAAALRREDFYHAGDQWMLHFNEKRGRSREIPVRHDLEKIIFAYLDAGGLRMRQRARRSFRAPRREKRSSRALRSTSTMFAG